MTPEPAILDPEPTPAQIDQCLSNSGAGILAGESAGHPCPAISSPSGPSIQQLAAPKSDEGGSINPTIQQSTASPLQPSITPSLQPAPARRRVGKIAQLPKNQRDTINRLLDDGSTYKVIEQEMAKQDISLNGENISNWFQGGY